MNPLVKEIDHHCMQLTFNRPEVKNALDLAVFEMLHEALEEARHDKKIRCVLITGSINDAQSDERQAFTSGMDLSAMSPENIEHYQNAKMPHPALACIDSICTFDKPLVAAVNGVGLGLGFTLLLHCDKVFMSDKAKLKAPFIDLGLPPEAGASFLLPQLVGYKRAAQLLFDPQWISAEEAQELGISDQLCSPNALVQQAKEYAQLLCSKAPHAMRHTKRLMKRSYQCSVVQAKKDEDRAFEALVGREENTEAITAFFEKRPANFG